MQFIKAVIAELTTGLFELTLFYTYWNLYNYEDTFTYKTLQEAKDKLLLERTRDQLHIILLSSSNI